MRARGWVLFSSENPPTLGICLGEQHVEACTAFAVDLAAAAAESCRGDGVATVARRRNEVVGNYQSAGKGVSEEVLRAKLVRYIERGLDDAPGTPESRL